MLANILPAQVWLLPSTSPSRRNTCIAVWNKMHYLLAPTKNKNWIKTRPYFSRVLLTSVSVPFRPLLFRPRLLTSQGLALMRTAAKPSCTVPHYSPNPGEYYSATLWATQWAYKQERHTRMVSFKTHDSCGTYAIPYSRGRRHHELNPCGS